MFESRKVWPYSERKICKEHKLWLESGGLKGVQAHFSGCNMRGLDFSLKDLRFAIFVNCKVIETDFYKCNLQGAFFLENNLKESSFISSNLRNTTFGSNTYEDTRFDYADITDACFRIDISGAMFYRAKSEGTCRILTYNHNERKSDAFFDTHTGDLTVLDKTQSLGYWRAHYKYLLSNAGVSRFAVSDFKRWLDGLYEKFGDRDENSNKEGK